MSIFSFSIKQDKAESCKQKVTITSVAVAATKFLFGMCDGTVDSFARAIARVSGHGLINQL